MTRTADDFYLDRAFREASWNDEPPEWDDEDYPRADDLVEYAFWLALGDAET